jgi:EXS family
MSGPALLAFTLMMAAYSLRTWRRNGVACDELIFLPGTHHGIEHGIDGPLIEQPVPAIPEDSPSGEITTTIDGMATIVSTTTTTTASQAPPPTNEANRQVSEPDRAAGALRQRARSEDVEMTNLVNGVIGPAQSTKLSSNTSHSCNDDLVIHPSTSNDEEDIAVQKESLLDDKSQESWDMEEDDGDDDEERREATTSTTATLLYRNATAVSATGDGGSGSTPEQRAGTGSNGNNRVQRFRENHPQLARLGTFFFFRASGPATQQNAAYAPSGPTVFGAALDLSMPVLFNFHLFIEAWNHMSAPDGSEAPAKILPLIFLSVLIVRTVVPPGRRLRFWGTLKFTFTAPFHQVCVRDEFIGDCLTSWVRPSQDLFFALSYYSTVIWGTVTGRYGLTESGEILAESWLLHNMLMPAFAILPLWLKYLQTLRQAYDADERWPHLFNSFKYLSASLVIIYGMTHTGQRRSVVWLTCFVLTLLYQIFWDTIMDWQLFEIQRDIQLVDSSSDHDTWCAQVSSFRPESRILLNLQIYAIQPVLDRYQRIRAQIPSWRNIQLRQQRLYKTEAFYWKIFAFNTLTRFTWMCCFIPAYHISRSRAVLYSTSDVNSYWGVLLPASEIFRRILWGFLYMEKETLKMMESDAKYQRVAGGNGEIEDDDMDDINSKFGQDRPRPGLLPTWLGNQQQAHLAAATTRAKQHEQLMKQIWQIELALWAVAFVVLGAWAAR